METSFRSKVMKQAHAMRKETNKGFSICLMKAWGAYRLTKRMASGIVRFAFEKVDGSLRYAVGTLQNIGNKLTGNGSHTDKTVCYYDTEAIGFRSFKIQNLLNIY